MAWRVQWRERTPKGAPSTVKHEDGHNLDSAGFKVKQLLDQAVVPCWINLEDLESTHKGSSSELARKRAAAAEKKK